MTGEQRETVAQVIGVLDMVAALLKPELTGGVVTCAAESLQEMLEKDEPVG